MDNSSETHKRQKFGFEKFSNSKVLSDITIRYGASGELKFEAHRLLLSAKSRWFEAAFTGGFAESHAREIALVGDDPDALKTMLSFAYDEQIHPQKDWLDGTTVNVNRFLEIYRVGDKYQFSAFLVWVASQFAICMYAWMDMAPGSIGKNSVALSDFSDFVRDIYELVGSEHQPNHPLIEDLLNIASGSVLCNTGGRQPLIVMASQKVAEFGRGIFLRLMDETRSSETDGRGNAVTTELCIGVVLECRSCGEISWKVMMTDEERLHEVCIVCGGDFKYRKKGSR